MVYVGGNYVNEDVNSVATKLNEYGGKIYGKADSVIQTRYCTEIYV